MGGSELAMLQLMQAVHATRAWHVSVLLFQPAFGEDDHGNLELQYGWLDRLYQFTDDVVDVSALAPFHRTAELLRYVLETRLPDALLFTNGRWVYQQLALVRFVMPNLVIADYNHMVYKYWKGGGNPRYGTNHTEFIDYHFTASNNVTNAMRTWVAERGYDRRKVSTCYIGTDLSIILTGNEKQQARHDVRTRLGISPKATLVLFAGRFVMEKGLDVLVATVKRLSPSQPQLSFLIVGDGDSAYLLDDISLPGRVVVHPPVYDDDLRQFYASADICLLPSVNEGIALVLYEAMASGLLVVATDVGGQKELVTSSRGILIKPGSLEEVTERVVNAITDVVENPKRYDRVRATARRDIQRLYNVQNFQNCVINPLINFHSPVQYNSASVPISVLTSTRDALLEERQHSTWAMGRYPLRADRVLSIGVVSDACERTAGNLTEVCGGTNSDEHASSMYTQFSHRYPGVPILVVSVLERADQFSRNSNIDFVAGERNPVKRCSSMYLLREATLACNTELIAFADNQFLSNAPDLQKLVNVVRAESWDVLGVSTNTLNRKTAQEETLKRITHHDRNLDAVRTCTVPESEVVAIETDPDKDAHHPNSVSIAPYLLMARVEALQSFFEEYRNEDFSTTQMFVGFWKLGLRVGYLPAGVAQSTVSLERLRPCKPGEEHRGSKESVFEVLDDKEECPLDFRAVKFWP